GEPLGALHPLLLEEGGLTFHVRLHDLRVVEGEGERVEHLGGGKLGVALEDALDGSARTIEGVQATHWNPGAAHVGAPLEHLLVHAHVGMRNQDDGQGRHGSAAPHDDRLPIHATRPNGETFDENRATVEPMESGTRIWCSVAPVPDTPPQGGASRRPGRAVRESSKIPSRGSDPGGRIGSLGGLSRAFAARASRGSDQDAGDSSSRIRSATCAAVNPNLVAISFHGAEAPKRSRPMQIPSSPAIARHGVVTPISKVARRTPGGSTAFFFSGGRRRNASTQGIETTRTRCARAPSSARSRSAFASRATDTSLPVAMSTRVGSAA